MFVALAGWLAAGACDPRDFDELGAKAPVQVAEPPSGLDHFGPALVSLDRKGSDADRPQLAVAVGSGTEAVVVAHALSDGRLELRSGAESPQAGTSGGVMALAQTSLLSGPDGSSPGVLVGVPGFGVVYAATVGETGEPMPLANKVLLAGDCGLGDRDEFGGGVGAADLDGDGTDEWVVRSWDRVCLFDSNKPKAGHLRCELAPNCTDCDRFHSWDGPVAAGRLMDLPGGRSTAVVGLPGQTQGKVAFLAWTGAGPVADATDCHDSDMVRRELQGPAGESSFGASLLVEDLDGDGWDELVVGAPGEHKVFVYSIPSGDASDWAGATPVLEVTPDDAAQARAFGQGLALVDLDGDGRLELAVGDPEATVGAEDLAGRVFLFSLDIVGGSVIQIGVIEETEPDRAHHFGKSLGRVVPSGQSWSRSGGVAHELVVAADEGLYLYLETGIQEDAWPR